MSDADHQPSGHGQSLAPTLTEVVEAWESGSMPLDGQRAEAALMTESFRGRWDASVGAAVATQTERADAPAPVPAPAPEAAPLNEDQIVQRVLLDLQRQIDLMLEYRVREALIPALTRATDALVLEARNELASTLRGIVSKSVAQELARVRGQGGKL
jgi:hypothetical protein